MKKDEKSMTWNLNGKFVVDGYGIIICEVFQEAGIKIETNGLLIAAAPDLLEACKKAFKTFKEMPRNRERDECVSNLKEAIRKAGEKI